MMGGGMEWVTGLRCLRCGARYTPADNGPHAMPDNVHYLCGCRPNVGSDLGVLDVEYSYDAMKAALKRAGFSADVRSMARYSSLLPVQHVDSLPPAPVGDTPLYHAPRLGAEVEIARLYIKDDGRNPSGSLKDRASAIAVAKARELGRAVVATASTGNAAAALAQQSAAAGMPCVIFVPRTAPPAKIAQLLAFGARVFAVRGSYDQAFDLCVAACDHFGWYNRNTGMNPYMSEGKKTVAFEIAEQMSTWAGGETQAAGLHAPDAVFVSVGDGCIIGGVYKGFYDLQQLGWIERMPRLFGVQSELSPALYNAWRAGNELPEPVQATTRADSISVDAPRDAVKALRAVRASNGAFVRVPDAEILAAIPALARKAAVFAEPAGAAAWAGLVEARRLGLVDAAETVVVINTGTGLKDIDAVRAVSGAPVEIDASLAAVAAAMPKDDWVIR